MCLLTLAVLRKNILYHLRPFHSIIDTVLCGQDQHGTNHVGFIQILFKKYSSHNKEFENLNDIVGAPESSTSLNGNLSMKDYYLKLSGLKELKSTVVYQQLKVHHVM